MSTPEIILTAEGRQKLVDELAWREGEKNDEIIERIKEARDFGDLSENSEYDDAKEEQSKNASRITEIRSILASAKVSDDAGAKKRNIPVSIGCKVELADDSGEKETFTIVGTTETNSLENRISNESPLGKALMGHKKGDAIEFAGPTGKVFGYTITRISR
ncbi:MAG: transcription elongation factor GreA [Atopobiaceae bacterium]|jgi:transcription elongation factor GreA|nr:transcription elongation factor GreA [Atopobiaceae bacterium]